MNKPKRIHPEEVARAHKVIEQYRTQQAEDRATVVDTYRAEIDALLRDLENFPGLREWAQQKHWDAVKLKKQGALMQENDAIKWYLMTLRRDLADALTAFKITPGDFFDLVRGKAYVTPYKPLPVGFDDESAFITKSDNVVTITCASEIDAEEITDWLMDQIG